MMAALMQQNARCSSYWDNIKGILIFLVVVAHFAMPYAALQDVVRGGIPVPHACISVCIWLIQ